MPQMAPMSWTLLFMFFTVSLISVLVMNYYYWVPAPSRIEKGSVMTTHQMNWKW